MLRARIELQEEFITAGEFYIKDVLYRLQLIMDSLGVKDPLDVPGLWYVVSDPFDGWRHYAGTYRDCVFYARNRHRMVVISEAQYMTDAIAWKEAHPDWFGYQHQFDSFLINWDEVGKASSSEHR